MPFGGVKGSGFGRFGGTAAINEFTEIHWVTVQSGSHPFPSRRGVRSGGDRSARPGGPRSRQRRRRRRARGFTHLIPHAAGHELIRQGKRRLTLVRMTPDVVYDQLIGMGCAQARLLVGRQRASGHCTGCGTPSSDWPAPLELEEHSHAGMAAGYAAGASNFPFGLVRGYEGTGLAERTNVGWVTARSPVSGSLPSCLDPSGRSSMRSRRTRGQRPALGISGVQKEVVLGAKRSIVTVEEIVEELDQKPGSTQLPAWTVAAVCECPGGAHPSYSHGYYDRDNAFYVSWDASAATATGSSPGCSPTCWTRRTSPSTTAS